MAACLGAQGKEHGRRETFYIFVQTQLGCQNGRKDTKNKISRTGGGQIEEALTKNSGKFGHWYTY